jgi:sodium-dependent phosphate cotransporter
VFPEGKARIIHNRVINPPPIMRLFVLLGLLYVFFVSIALMGASFKFFGKGFAEQLLTTTSNPFAGLFIGILATSLVQSSSTITSMVVGLVAGGALTVSGAIPIVIGSNIGTTVTNILVSLGHISRPKEFRRAFAAATLHDFFNLVAVIVIFPLQLATDFLGKTSTFLANQFAESGGMKLLNPLKLIVSPTVKFIELATNESGVLMLIIAVVLLFIALRYIVVNLRSLVIGKVEQFFNETLFKNSFTAMMLGLGLTVMVQSSSITTSLVVPLAAARILTLRTITAILASLVTNDQAAVTVAFAHLLFNITGILLIWPIRNVPIFLAQKLAKASIRSRFIPILYILVVFFLIPIVLISLTR